MKMILNAIVKKEIEFTEDAGQLKEALEAFEDESIGQNLHGYIIVEVKK